MLEPYAFRNVHSGAEIQVSGNTISEIPTGAFSGRRSATVDLKNLGIKTLHSDAFGGTSDLSILLQGNSVSTLFPDAFPEGVVRGENCSDYVGWTVLCATLESELTCDQTTCSTTSPYLAADLGVDAVDACCALGGGHPGGANLIMDEVSPITCSSSTSSDEVTCRCSDETQRYDVMTSSCISSCMSGEKWESVISHVYDSINSDIGRCVPCSSGTFSIGSIDGWMDTCLNCSAGKYVATNGSSACLQCDVGTYTATQGKSACDLCSTGTYSEFSKGSSTCRNCTEGTYADSNGTSACFQCDAGKYAFEKGKSECDKCPTGTYSEFSKGSMACLECSPGTYSSEGSAMCSSCPRGRYSMHNASTQCDVCLSGHHTGGFEDGSSVCLKCDPGMFIIALCVSSAPLTSVIHNQNRHLFINKLYSRM